MESISWTNKWALMGIVMVAIVVIQELPNYTIAVLPSIRISPFSQNYYVGWSTGNSAIFNRGYNINLTLDKFSGTIAILLPTILYSFIVLIIVILSSCYVHICGHHLFS